MCAVRADDPCSCGSRLQLYEDETRTSAELRPRVSAAEKIANETIELKRQVRAVGWAVAATLRCCMCG